MIKKYSKVILNELWETLGAISEQTITEVVEHIVTAPRIFVAGTGRTGFMMRAFAMRLSHLGFRVYVVGETTTPAIVASDLLLVGSGSGETKSLVITAQGASDLEAKVVSFSTIVVSSLANLSDVCCIIPAKAKNDNCDFMSIQPMGSLFEQSLLILLDSIVLALMERAGSSSSDMYQKHANLE